MPLGKEDVDDWNVLMLSSFVLLQFFSNSFVFDQLCIRSTRSWALLFWPLGIVSDTVVSSTYFHMLKMLGTDKSLIMGRKSQGPNMVPWGTPDGTLPYSDNQSLLSLTLWDLSERTSITQLIILLGTFICFNFVTKILWSIRSKTLR